MIEIILTSLIVSWSGVCSVGEDGLSVCNDGNSISVINTIDTKSKVLQKYPLKLIYDKNWKGVVRIIDEEMKTVCYVGFVPVVGVSVSCVKY